MMTRCHRQCHAQVTHKYNFCTFTNKHTCTHTLTSVTQSRCRDTISLDFWLLMSRCCWLLSQMFSTRHKLWMLQAQYFCEGGKTTSDNVGTIDFVEMIECCTHSSENRAATAAQDGQWNMFYLTLKTNHRYRYRHHYRFAISVMIRIQGLFAMATALLISFCCFFLLCLSYAFQTGDRYPPFAPTVNL